ncbi:unnamed protein product [Paramecium primaurelia]|uniref:Uncharacterized protein n=1 Tax=Paramecium primaurelia TaxID=5886 RepID=A0A8S1JX03_PARPR|nr:unnamed protein product [Paramecium primaurelia]
MFDDDFDLGKQIDLANEVKEMEVKVNTLQEKSQQDRYLGNHLMDHSQNSAKWYQIPLK